MSSLTTNPNISRTLVEKKPSSIQNPLFSSSPSSYKNHQRHSSFQKQHPNTLLDHTTLSSPTKSTASKVEMNASFRSLSPQHKLFSVLNELDTERENELREMIDMIEDPAIDEFPSIQEPKTSSSIGNLLPSSGNSSKSGFSEELLATRPSPISKVDIRDEKENHDSELPSENIVPEHALPICPSVDNERLMQYLSSLKIDFEESVRVRNSLLEKQEEYTSTIRDLNNQLVNYKERVRKYEEFFALSRSNTSLEQLRGELLQQKSQELETCRNELRSMHDKCNVLTTEHEDIKSQKNIKIKSLANEVQRLSQLLSQSETLLSSRNNTIRNLEEKLSALKSKYLINQNKIDEFDGFTSKSQEKVISLERTIEQLKREKAELDKRAKGAVEDLNIIKKEKSQIEKNFFELKATLEDYQERLKRAEDASQSKVVIEDYSRSVSESFQFKLQKLRKQHEEEMSRTCVEYEETIQNLRAMLQEKSHEKKITFDMGTQAMTITVDNSSQTSDLPLNDTQKKELQKLVEEVKRLNVKCSKLENENTDLIQTLEKEKHEFEMEKQRILSEKYLEIETLSSNIGMLEGNHENTINSLKNQVSSLEQKHSELFIFTNQLKEQLERKEKEIEELVNDKNKSLLTLRQQMSKDKEFAIRSECERIYKDKNKQIDEMRERITQLEEKSLKEDIQCKKLEQLNQSFKNRIEELKNDIIELQHAKEVSEKKANDYDRVYKHCIKYKKNLDRLKKEFALLVPKCERLEESVKFLRNENTELRRRQSSVD
ncbi:hypothetical protein C9374_006191 [Naegleria lovaniensis]|uniref:Uncharacterized protein n=1 Tax=Naegleria lovaniensis TaxID=51637 RepID=A0AA88GNY3_NAELO|nr:uncharacterized protein C9374_006191 [Naegleria lovaniensis]KAG2381807.1 hypothetical protein C9374_006191 [Naegleria lovaniensis]